jgi:site-specific DNA recombinase
MTIDHERLAADLAKESFAAAKLSFAFYGRVSTEDNQDPESSRQWQLSLARNLIAPRGGVISDHFQFFDIGQSRSLPWSRRPEASRLLAALQDPGRGFTAVVIGEPHRAFYGNQFGLTLPLFAHYGVQLWVPEVGGPIDPDNEAHDLVMSVFGGMSKGERNRIKVRVRTAMASQTQVEGRFLGGRPPYGYTLADLGPHPNPAKAADGRRLHGLIPDTNTAPVVQRIYTEFLAGNGLYVIAEGLTADGILSPSGYDRKRNPHRPGVAWSKSAVRVILTNPRYTGRQVWNRQRTDEVLLDVNDVALGNTTVMRWNPKDRWVISKDVVHPPLIDADTFEQVQQLLHRRGDGPGFEHKQHRSRHPYVLKGLVYCGLCHRRMQGQRSNGEAYYRCRYAQEYALANKIDHPRNVYLRERDIVGSLDTALAAAFAPGRIGETVAMMAATQGPEPVEREPVRQARARLVDCDAKLAQYRAALDAGADPVVVTGWISEVQNQRRQATEVLNTPRPQAPARMSPEQITDLVRQLGDIAAALGEADPADRAEVYQQLGLRLTYHPEIQKVRVQAQPVADSHGDLVCVRGGT